MDWRLACKEQKNVRKVFAVSGGVQCENSWKKMDSYDTILDATSIFKLPLSTRDEVIKT